MNEFEAVALRLVEKSKAEGREIAQLPFWDDDQRGAPTAVLRSSLFGVIKRGKRKAVEDQTLAAWGGNEIRYTGFRLDQADLDCWLQVLHLARQFPLGQDVRFTARGFLKSIDRPGDGNSHRWLRRSIGRMQACGVCVRTSSGQQYQGPLISDFFVDEASGRYVIRINPLLAVLFDEAFVKLSMEKRRLLRSDLACWLQGYVQSHRATPEQPHRIGVEKLMQLCGSETNLRDFRWKTKKAMTELQEQGIVASWRITDGGALEFSRPQTTA